MIDQNNLSIATLTEGKNTKKNCSYYVWIWIQYTILKRVSRGEKSHMIEMLVTTIIIYNWYIVSFEVLRHWIDGSSKFNCERRI